MRPAVASRSRRSWAITEATTRATTTTGKRCVGRLEVLGGGDRRLVSVVDPELEEDLGHGDQDQPEQCRPACSGTQLRPPAPPAARPCACPPFPPDSASAKPKARLTQIERLDHAARGTPRVAPALPTSQTSASAWTRNHVMRMVKKTLPGGPAIPTPPKTRNTAAIPASTVRLRTMRTVSWRRRSSGSAGATNGSHGQLLQDRRHPRAVPRSPPRPRHPSDHPDPLRQAAPALFRRLRRARLAGVDLVERAVGRWSEVRHDDVRAAEQAALPSPRRVERREGGRARDVGVGADEAREGDDLRRRLLVARDLLAFRCEREEALAERCRGMRDVRPDADHVEVHVAEEDDVRGEAFEVLARDADEDAAPDLVPKGGEAAEDREAIGAPVRRSKGGSPRRARGPTSRSGGGTCRRPLRATRRGPRRAVHRG